MSTTVPTTTIPIKPMKVRLLLAVGGILGLHRLHMNHIPEAFIFASTLGMFFIGVLYDSLYIHGELEAMELENDEQEDCEETNKFFKNGKVIAHRVPPFSLSKFVYSVLYGTYLGFLCWIAGTITFGHSMSDSIFMLSSIAIAITAGVYLVGNCGKQSRNLLYIWMGCFSSTFLFARLLQLGLLKTLLFSSIAGTFLGNRSARYRPTSVRPPFTWRHYMFWCSLFALMVCVVAVGASRHILEKRITASRPGESSLTTSIGALITERFHSTDKVQKFFANEPKLSFEKARQTKSSIKSPMPEWFDLDSFVVGKAPLWADYVTVFIVDLLRSEILVKERKISEEPLKWAAWRQYLVVAYASHPFASDMDLLRICRGTVEREQRRRKNAGKAESDYELRSADRACQMLKAAKLNPTQ